MEEHCPAMFLPPIQAFSPPSYQGKVQPASSIVDIIGVSERPSSWTFRDVTVCVCQLGQKSEQSLNAHSLHSRINLDPRLLHHSSKTQREKKWSGTHFILFICNVSKHAINTRSISN